MPNALSHWKGFSQQINHKVKQLKQQALYSLASLMRRAHTHDVHFDFEKVIPYEITFKLVKTPFSAQPFLTCFSILPQWYRKVASTSSDRPEEIRFKIAHDGKGEGKHLQVQKNGMYNMILTDSDDTAGILEAILCGVPGSTFRYNYPMGIDITEFARLVFSPADSANTTSPQLLLSDMIPLILSVFAKSDVYPAESLYLDVLQDDTFDVIKVDYKTEIKSFRL